MNVAAILAAEALIAVGWSDHGYYSGRTVMAGVLSRDGLFVGVFLAAGVMSGKESSLGIRFVVVSSWWLGLVICLT